MDNNMDAKKITNAIKMLKLQDKNTTKCKTCGVFIKYSIKNNEITSFNTRNSNEQMCCFNHIGMIQKSLDSCTKNKKF
jgi:peptide subunit release factor 1 (eRF1)